MGFITNLLRLQLPFQQGGIHNLKFIRNHLRQKFVQSSVNRLFLFLAVAVPVDNFVGKALAAPADGVAQRR